MRDRLIIWLPPFVIEAGLCAYWVDSQEWGSAVFTGWFALFCLVMLSGRD